MLYVNTQFCTHHRFTNTDIISRSSIQSKNKINVFVVNRQTSETDEINLCKLRKTLNKSITKVTIVNIRYNVTHNFMVPSKAENVIRLETKMTLSTRPYSSIH